MMASAFKKLFFQVRNIFFPLADERGMLPVETKTGIQLISVNLLLDDETDPVIWLSRAISGALPAKLPFDWQQVWYQA